MAVKLNVAIPEHVPGVRTPSKHNVGEQVNPEMPVFVHDDPEGSITVQSPGPSAFGSSSEASQGPSKAGEQNTIKKTEPLRRHGRLENENAAAQLHGPIMPRNCTVFFNSVQD